MPTFSGVIPPNQRYLDAATLETLFHFPRDMDRRDGPIQRLDNQVLVRLYEQDWGDLAGR